MMAEQERPSARRRGSVGRAFERMRHALKRRRSSAAAGATLAATSEEGTTATPAAVKEAPEAPEESKASDRATVGEPQVVDHGKAKDDAGLEPDDQGDDVDVNEEPLTLAFSSRVGLNEEKKKALLDRYGIKYQPRSPPPAGDSASPGETRRVERPVRVRIHWTCHECERPFGHGSACPHCGHRRCEHCTRSPPRKVKAILDAAKQAQMAEERTAANTDQILAAIAPDTVAAPAEARLTDDQALELEVDDGKDLDVSHLSMPRRPSSGIRLAVRSKAPARRRVCHECQTPFLLQNRIDCGTCGHQRCNACPTRNVTAAGKEEAAFEPTMVATVQRVYRKPRQRVRWQCDRCKSVIADSQTCRVCDHQRCATCVRSPVKRVAPQPDPAVLQSLNDKIEAWQRQRGTAPESTTVLLVPEVS